jgi:hypothetical protein
MYNQRSNRKLNLILKNGYTFKHLERRHYYANRSTISNKIANQEFLNATVQNKAMLSCMEHKSQPREGPGLSASSNDIYAEMFTDRYIKLTQSIMDTLQEKESSGSPRVCEGRVTEELNNAKKNQIYKELGMNINLKEMFQTLSYDDLMKLRKLHVLHATQKGKQGKIESQAESK